MRSWQCELLMKAMMTLFQSFVICLHSQIDDKDILWHGYKTIIWAVKLQGVAVLRPSEWMPCQQIFIKTLWTIILAEENSEMKSTLYVEQGYIVQTQHSATCYEKEYVLECDSRSYGCSMISRLVWMNLDTQDTCNIKQIPSPDWHTRYMQHKTSSIPSMFHLTHTYITVQ